MYIRLSYLHTTHNRYLVVDYYQTVEQNNKLLLSFLANYKLISFRRHISKYFDKPLKIHKTIELQKINK